MLVNTVVTREEFIQELIKRNGSKVNIRISHKLYGPQKISCKLDAFYDNERVGFHVYKKEIYMLFNEIVYVDIIGNMYIMHSDVMELSFNFI